MEFDVEKERTFNCPEGTFRAVFKGIRKDAKFKDGKLQEVARMTLEVKVPSMPDKIVTVARNFEPSIRTGSTLREMLEAWLGKQFFSQNAGTKINLDGQIDKEADIVVKHCHNEGFSKPYCHLLAMLPPGSLALGEVANN
jgi:hypothetical protein